MKTFRIISLEKKRKYKIQGNLLWGLLWYDVEEEEWNGTDLVSFPRYFNSVKEAEDYIKTHLTKDKETVVKVFKVA